MNLDMTTISLFTGIGGLDFGFEAAGYRTTVAIEMDPVVCQTLRLNRPTWKVIEKDIDSVSSQEILNVAGLKVGEADVLLGGPPCQPFSKSSYCVNGDTARMKDPRASTLSAYLRILRETRPKVFVLENVDGLAYRQKDEGLRFLLDGISVLNQVAGTKYRVEWRVLNAANYGVPQLRRRIFLVGSREGSMFTFPRITHCKPEKLDESVELSPYRTAWDAIGDLPPPSNDPLLNVGGTWGALLPTIPEGKNYLWHTERGKGQPIFGWRTRYSNFLLKLAKNQPSWTIQAHPGSAIGPFHWLNRKLTVREMCRLQTFPHDIQIDSTRHNAQRMIGNAVPSLLAEILGREIRRQLLNSRVENSPLSLETPLRDPIPDPETATTVPAIYLKNTGSGMGI